jgi:glycosyltransferase involved in cell wall biosynthesis
MPVYNGERFLAETLDSLLAQTFGDFEVVISDNASTDATRSICLDYAARDNRIRYFRNASNIGAIKNYNRVFELSSGEYFKWAAADDLIAPTFLESCVAALDRDETAVVAYPDLEIIDEAGRMLRSYGGSNQAAAWSQDPASRFRRFVREMSTDRSSEVAIYFFGLIRTSALLETRLYGTYMGAEYNLIAELVLLGRFTRVPAPLLMLRVHEGSLQNVYGKSLDQVRRWYDPAIRGWLQSLVWRRRSRFEFFAAVVRSNLTLSQKVSLLVCNLGEVFLLARLQLGRAVMRVTT